MIYYTAESIEYYTFTPLSAFFVATFVALAFHANIGTPAFVMVQGLLTSLSSGGHPPMDWLIILLGLLCIAFGSLLIWEALDNKCT